MIIYNLEGVLLHFSIKLSQQETYNLLFARKTRRDNARVVCQGLDAKVS